jgi:branched-chain amino acid transport system substrate-binding protein
MLAPNGTVAVVDKTSQFHPWVFRSTTNDVINAQKMLDALVKSGAKKLAIFHEENAYGKGTSDFIHSVAAKAGVSIVETVAAPSKAIDLTSQATKLRNSNVDGVLMQVSSPALGGAFARAAKQVGLKAPIIGPIGLGQKAFIEAAGDAGDGVQLIVVANWDAPSPRMEELGKLLTANHKPPRGFGEVMGTNGLLAVVAAAKSVKSELTGAAIRDALENVCGLETYSTGRLCYSADNHDGWGEDVPFLVEIKNGKFVPK